MCELLTEAWRIHCWIEMSYATTPTTTTGHSHLTKRKTKEIAKAQTIYCLLMG